MRHIAFLLAVVVLVAGSASADFVLPTSVAGNPNYSATGGLWTADAGNFFNGLGLPDEASSGAIVRDTDLTFDVNLDFTAANDPANYFNNFNQLKGPGYNNGTSGIWAIADGVSLAADGARFGHGGTGMSYVNVGVGSVLDIMEQMNMPRSSSSAADCTMSLDASAILEAGALNINKATSAIIMDPSAVIRVVGYASSDGSSYTLANDPAALVASGQIIGSGGETPVVSSIMGVDGTMSGYEIAIPEPATLSVLALGGLAILRRRR